ncbi:MAG: ComEC/Rec2 family competence protein, partial [Casimicrobiaceae bacterium]
VQTNSHTLLYDTGPRFNDLADAGNRIIAPYLRAQGIRELDGIVVTHADADHSGGLLSVLASVPVGWITSSMSEQSKVVIGQKEAGRVHVPCFAGQAWTWDGVRFEMLHPSGESYRDPKIKTNDRGCVLKITSAHGSMLLTADIEARSEAELVSHQRAALRSDVILVPHHGSKTSSTQPFLDAVRPAIAIATPGYRNRLGHPRPEVVERYVAQGARLLRSDYDGAVELRFEGGPPKIRAWREVDRRYWRDQPRRDQPAALD